MEVSKLNVALNRVLVYYIKLNKLNFKRTNC